jgi:hypothetical protein
MKAGARVSAYMWWVAIVAACVAAWATLVWAVLRFVR